MVVSFAAGVAVAAEPAPIQLVKQPNVVPHLAAFPRIAAPDGPAMQRINQHFANADVRARKAAEGCDWKRSVTATMRGPRFLALIASDDWYCPGTAHPDADSFALTYDLKTGAPLNWDRLLPKALGMTATLDYSGDATPLGVVASPKLTALYAAAAKAKVADHCLQELHDSDLHFILWPDARREGIAMQPSYLDHADAVCGVDVAIPLPTWRQLGVAPTLLDAIAAAHEAKLYDPTP